MFGGKKVIVLAWSPIGYEIYLTLRSMLPSEDVILISARNFNPPEAHSSLGINHHFFSQSEEQVKDVCLGLEKTVTHAAGLSGEFILFVPQMGNFYARSMIESDLCRRFFIYDEGSAAYGLAFIERYKKIWMRQNVRASDGLANLYSSCKVEYKKMSSLYKAGVKFYELDHPKLDGLVSFFPDAFPGFEKIQVPIAPVEPTKVEAAILVLLPPIRLFKENKNYIKYYSERLLSIGGRADTSIVLKPHPGEKEVPLDSYMKLLGIREATSYSSFAKSFDISPYREVAFMGFKSILSYGNSTELYIDQLSKLN